MSFPPLSGIILAEGTQLQTTPLPPGPHVPGDYFPFGLNFFPGNGNGSADNAAALAGLTAPAVVLPGNYFVGSNVTAGAALVFMPGAVFKPGPGVTITFAGKVYAGQFQIFDSSLGGTVQLPKQGTVHLHWWSGGDGNVTTALLAAVASVQYIGGNNLSRTIQIEEGLYITDSGVVSGTPLVFEGRSSYGSAIQISDAFPPNGVIFTWTTATAPAALLNEESHLPIGGLRHLTVDGNGRHVAAHAMRFQKADRAPQFLDVAVRNLKGSVITGASFRETDFSGLKSWLCGSPTAPVIDLRDDGTGGADGHNLIHFIGGEFALNCGDPVYIGTDSLTQLVRTIWFDGTVFHGLTETLDYYPDNRGHNGDKLVPLEMEGAHQGRHVFRNCRSVFYSNCRFILPSRGQPLFLLDQSGAGASTVNGVLIGGGNVITERIAFNAVPVSVVTPATDTFNCAAIGQERHHLQTGSRVQMTVPTIPASVLPAPLALATDYYAIVVDANNFKLATTRANALAATPIDITDGGSGSLPSVVQQDAVFTATAATDIINCPDHRLATEARIQVATTTTLPAPLAVTTDYFVIRVDKDNFKLATTRANAIAGTAIDITTAGAGTQFWTPVVFAFDIAWGTLSVGQGNQYEGVPTRAWARIETGQSLNWNTLGDPNFAPGARVTSEWGSGGFLSNTVYGGLVLADNNIGLYGTTAGGVAVALAKIATNGNNVFGAPDNNANTVINAQTVLQLLINNAIKLDVRTAGIGFNGVTNQTKPTITGSRGGNAALASLLTALATMGLLTDSTTV